MFYIMWMTAIIKCYIGDKIKCSGPDDRFSDYRVSGGAIQGARSKLFGLPSIGQI